MFKKLFSIKISLLYIVVPIIISSTLFLLAHYESAGHVKQTSAVAGANIENTTITCEENTFRLKGFEYIKPIVNENRECESSKYSSLKDNIKGFIDDEAQKGDITTASIYLKNLEQGEDWIGIYPDLEYHPASLGKVPILITYLKKAETTPGLLDMEVTFNKDSRHIPKQNFVAETIKMGHTYKVRELLYFMIANSDNHATSLLQDHIDFAAFKKTFTDFGMGDQKLIDTNYMFRAKEFSIFLEALYNAGYLNSTSSEYASSLLAQCKFKQGLLKDLPPNVKAIHKFGECEMGENRELHESAIIYLDNHTYLITVMTKGTDFTKLSNLMGHISKMVYDYMTASS